MTKLLTVKSLVETLSAEKNACPTNEWMTDKRKKDIDKWNVVQTNQVPLASI